MALENRGSRQYLYRKRRRGGRVVSEYVGIGSGYAAHIVQILDAYERQERQERREAWLDVVDADKALDAQLDEVTELVNVYADALMISTGYHQHKRQWRKQRK